ncbi:hypothetical protein QQ045_015983 [Rhodiola kirilowii]
MSRRRILDILAFDIGTRNNQYLHDNRINNKIQFIGQTVPRFRKETYFHLTHQKMRTCWRVMFNRFWKLLLGMLIDLPQIICFPIVEWNPMVAPCAQMLLRMLRCLKTFPVTLNLKC